MSICDPGSNESASSAFPARIQQDSVAKGLCDSTPEISTCDNDIQYCRWASFLTFTLVDSF